jgi:putative PIN family toxin of toxin-antitoxin system
VSSLVISEVARIRIVIDTVGFVKAMMGPASVWGEILFQRAHQIETMLSAQMVGEIQRVMTYPRVARRLASPKAASPEALVTIIQSATFVEVIDIPAVCRDPGDDIVLATALASAAQFILSEDNDLLDMIEYEGIRIVNGIELLEVLRG